MMEGKAGQGRIDKERENLEDGGGQGRPADREGEEKILWRVG